MKKYAFLSLMAVLALGACDDDDPTGNQGTAQVRVVNATSMPTGTGNNFASINAFRGTGNGTQIGTAVAAGSGSACTTTALTVPAGNQRISFRTQGSTTENAVINSYNFVAGERYTIIFYGTNTSPRSMVIQDERTQTAATGTNRRVRIINATTNATNFDVYARTTETGFPAAGSAIATNIATGTTAQTGANMYFTVPTANNIYQIYNAGATTGAARTSFTLLPASVPTSGNVTIVFTDNGAYAIPNCS